MKIQSKLKARTILIAILDVMNLVLVGQVKNTSIVTAVKPDMLS